MKYIVFLFIYTVAIAENSKDNEDRWIWGYVDISDNETIYTNAELKKANETTNDEPYDPCKPYNPEKPNFKAPGRRISEEKCEEYLWNLKLWDEQAKRSQECIDKLYTNEYPPVGAVGGRPTYSGEFPHMVGTITGRLALVEVMFKGPLGWKAEGVGYIFKCGSSLISSKYVLTAAHCSRAPVDDTITESDPKIVRLNDKNLFKVDSSGFITSTDVNIIKIINHPNYKPPKKYYDIALMELENEVTFTQFMQPACLWTKHDLTELGPDATLTGWGVLRFGSREISPELQAADVNLISSEQCDHLLYPSRNRNWQGLMEHQLCAGKLAGGVDACQGDSGGPLQIIKYNGKQNVLHNVIGVTSFGIGCALPNLPGIYTRVSSFVDWIEGIVWK